MRRNDHRSYAWRARVRDPAFTAMLAVQCLIMAAAPFVAMGYHGVRVAVQLLFFAFTVLIYFIAHGRITAAFAISAFTCLTLGYILQLLTPSTTSLVLTYTGSIGAFAVASYVLGFEVLASGAVTVHRVLGAIALYLNIGLMFGTIYRWIWYFIPNSLTNIPGGAGWEGAGAILYFSFVTLTSVSYGDIVPVHPITRMLANVEAIIGQLYPATVIARLITLELRSHRRRS